MDSLLALSIVFGLIVLAVLLGAVLHRTRTRVRRQPVIEGATVLTPDLFATDGTAAPGFGERATVVQFSTEHCARCPSTARVLAAEARARQGVSHIEIDVTRRDELIERFNVLRTPTVLLLDAKGRVHSRVSGPISTNQARELLETL